MRVLLLFQWQGGGIPEVFRQLVKAGLKDSVDLVSCIAEPVPSEKEKYFSEIGEWFDSRNGWFDFVKNLKRQISLADIVHVNSLKMLLLLLFLGEWRKVTIFQIHGEYSYLNRDSLQDRLKFFLLRTVLVLINVRGIICVNSYIDQLLGNVAILRSVIENGIVSESSPSLLPEKSRSHIPIVIGVGRLDPEKQFEKFIEIAECVNETLKAEFHIYGQGVLYPELQENIKQRNMQDIVKLKGFTQNPLAVMASADILLCTSSREGSPMTFAEALSVGLPIVTFPVGVARSLLQWGPAVCVSENVSELAKHIVRLLIETSGCNEKRRQRCVALFKECFDAKIKVRKYREIYNRAAGK